MKRGPLLVVSGFSGAGKGTVLSKVLEKRTDLYYSVSFTTRAPRTGEQDGVNYHFVTREAFQERIDRGEFLEYAEYVGNFYGTSMAVIREKLYQGVDVILEIESQGAAKVRQKMPEAVSLFLVPPSFEELSRRLHGRGTDSEEVIQRRLATARKEAKELEHYDYIVINDGSSDSTAKICRKNGYELVDLPVNLGLAGAFQTGLKYAYRNGYDYAIQFDADGQHRPEFIGPMLDKIQEGYDIVIGSRFVTEKKPHSLRMLGSNLISMAMKLTTGRRVKDPTSGMRMFNKKMIAEFALNMNYGPEPDTVSYLLKQGATIAEVQVEMDERIAGESYLNLTKSMMYMLRMLLSILLIQNFRKRREVKVS